MEKILRKVKCEDRLPEKDGSFDTNIGTLTYFEESFYNNLNNEKEYPEYWYEEVEKVYRDPLMFGEEGSIQRVYTKAYVEELLQKQRELCSEQAEPCMEFDGYKDYPSVDKDSILNAKLKINEC
jgi:hypothetical protein